MHRFSGEQVQNSDVPILVLNPYTCGKKKYRCHKCQNKILLLTGIMRLLGMLDDW